MPKRNYWCGLVTLLPLLLLFSLLFFACDLPTVGGTGEVFPQADGNSWTYHNDVEDNEWLFSMGSPRTSRGIHRISGEFLH